MYLLRRKTGGRPALEEAVASVPVWFHSIDLGHGVVTPGRKTPEILKWEMKQLSLPNLRGKSVLDIGAWDGFYSFEAERRGASRVVALDHYVWSIDHAEREEYLQGCRARGVVPEPDERLAHWRPGELPGKRGFDLAHGALRSRVQPMVADFMTCDLDRLGTFDIVLYLGVLYHMQDPLRALQRLARVTRERAIIETHAIYIRGHEGRALWEFYERDEINHDATNWWGPNMRGLHALCRAAGFDKAVAKVDPERAFRRSGEPVAYYRAVVHATKSPGKK